MQQTTPAARCALKPTFCDILETCVLAFGKDVLLAKLKSVEPSKFSTDHTETIHEKITTSKKQYGISYLKSILHM